MHSYQSFTRQMRADQSRWRKELADAEAAGFGDSIGKTLRARIAEGQSLLNDLARAHA